jgi:molybdopterin-guanine dinucleotide biosynthesis protein A
VIVDALVLCGGRSSRLGGTPKASLRYGDQSLLELTLAAASQVRHRVVVGDDEIIAAAAPGMDLIVARESPPFGGPAAAIGAGLHKLDSLEARVADRILVLGCDMPRVAAAVEALLAGSDTADNLVAVSENGQPELLVALYSRSSLAQRIAEHEATGDLENLSVRALVSGLDRRDLPVPSGSTDDVDTWLDARSFGIEERP